MSEDEKDPKEKNDEDESEEQPGKGEETLETLRAERDKWKALSRKHETAAKTNSAAAKKLQELEDKDKSESDRLTDRVTIAEKKAADAEREAARLRVGLRKGLTETQAKRLVGETEEELEADAKELLASFQPPANDEGKGKGDMPSGRPKERVRSGAAPNEEPDETDPAKLAAKVPRP
jgi:cell division septum initiation protein DivIVA